MKFVNLHGHTSFSEGDGHKLPADHIKTAKSLGMKALALTEHGNTSSHVQLEKAAQKEGVKPIYGVEAYVTFDLKERAKFHQTILAMNKEGYRNLNRLVTRSWGEGFHYFPTMHVDWLLDPEQTKGLILLSGCADSFLSCILAGGKSLGRRVVDSESYDMPQAELDLRMDSALNLISEFKEVYGDRFYLELQLFDNYPRTVWLNQRVEELSEATGTPVVATADVHYPDPEDWEIQRLSNAIKWHQSVDELAKNRDYEAGLAHLPRSDKEVAQRLHRTGVRKETIKEAILNTSRIAKRCNVTLPKTPPVRFSGSDGTDETAQKLLKRAILDGIEYRKKMSPAFAKDFAEREDEYKARIKKELRTILPKGFSDYFLINNEIIGWAKDNQIVVGPGRGSGASSLVCYLLRITEVNPLDFPQMVFERFLDPSRDDDPDIDTDYQDDRRNEVFEFARRVYGELNVGSIGNYARFRGRTAVKSAGKALKVPFGDTENFADLIVTPDFGDPREFNSAEDTEHAFEEAQKIVENYPDLRLAYRLEGDQRTLGVHAAGMVISNLPISETCAIYERTKSNGDKTEVIPFDKRDAEYLKMMKLDVLGLSTMTIIADTLAEVDDLTLEDLYALPRDIEYVLKGFADDDLTGIFQFEGRATRQVVRDIFSGTDKVPDFMQLADINALSRPGSLSSGMTAQYVAVERGEARKSLHPVVDEILKDTNGCLVYQEQVMNIGREFGGLKSSEIGRLRKIIGAKQAGGAFEEFWIKFRDGAMQQHGVSEDLARKVWEYMAASASYLFNISHAISYALVAYWTMYLKLTYPAEFFAASLRNASRKGKVKGKADPQTILLQDVVKHGLTVSPPEVMSSGITWKANPERTGVLAGFTQIPRVGERLAEAIIEYRDSKESVTVDDLVSDVPRFGTKAKEIYEKMRRSADPFEIHLTNDAVGTVVQAIQSRDIDLEFPNSTSATIPDQSGDFVTYVGHVVAVKLIDHIAEVRSRENLTQEEAELRVKDPHYSIKAKIICADPGGTEVHVNISRYNYPRLKEEISEIDTAKTFVIHVTGRADDSFGPSVQADNITAIELEG